MKAAKIFRHGNSQAVRLPKKFRFADDEVLIQRSGSGVLLLPREITYESEFRRVPGLSLQNWVKT